MNRHITFIVHPETTEQENALTTIIERLNIKFEITDNPYNSDKVTEVGKAKFLEKEKLDESSVIPEWQKREVRDRLASYEKNPDQARDFDSAMDEIDKDL